eukprot:6566237-Pyramimonas_sp.AAC.1
MAGIRRGGPAIHDTRANARARAAGGGPRLLARREVRAPCLDKRAPLFATWLIANGQDPTRGIYDPRQQGERARKGGWRRPPAAGKTASSLPAPRRARSTTRH